MVHRVSVDMSETIMLGGIKKKMINMRLSLPESETNISNKKQIKFRKHIEENSIEKISSRKNRYTC